MGNVTSAFANKIHPPPAEPGEARQPTPFEASLGLVMESFRHAKTQAETQADLDVVDAKVRPGLQGIELKMFEAATKGQTETVVWTSTDIAECRAVRGQLRHLAPSVPRGTVARVYDEPDMKSCICAVQWATYRHNYLPAEWLAAEPSRVPGTKPYRAEDYPSARDVAKLRERASASGRKEGKEASASGRKEE